MSKVQRRCLDGSVILGCILLASVALMTGWEGREQAQPLALTELVGWFKAQQQLVLPIAPPTADPFLQQGSPEALPFDLGDFPLEMLKQMPGKVRHDCPVYEIFLLEDPGTRATVILNGEGDAIYSVPAPTDYNPHAYAEAKFLELYSGTLGKMLTAALLAQYDPARIQVSVKLVPEDFYASYIAAEQDLTEQQALESGGGSMEPLGGGGTFAVTSTEFVGGHVELAFPGDSESYYVVESCIDPGDGIWIPVDVLLWEDYNMLWAGPDEAGAHRFYRVKAIARANPGDQDNDGLDDLSEMEVHHTDPLNPDSDGDGLLDGWEIGHDLDPLDDGTGGDPDQGADGDPDQDSLTNEEEQTLGTNPNVVNPIIQVSPNNAPIQYKTMAASRS